RGRKLEAVARLEAPMKNDGFLHRISPPLLVKKSADFFNPPLLLLESPEKLKILKDKASNFDTHGLDGQDYAERA
ncbi:unnamed protein product, partial [Amoebophrya sp. A25]